MFRIIFYLLVMIFLITIIRRVVGVLARAVSFYAGFPPKQTQSRSNESMPLAGELKKDPVCGTYVSAATSYKRTVDGATYYFCSPECRDKYVPTLAR